MRRIILAIATAVLAVSALAIPGVAEAAPHHPVAVVSMTPAQREQAAMNWALTQRGKWYQYGTAGPNTYDCSGLVYAAYLHEGLALPRTTYGMLASWHLVRVSTPKRGDLAFYGSGHVEFVTSWYRQTYGAHHTGTRIGYVTWTSYYHPTMYFEVR